MGLGKTIEAGLLLAQKWAERKRRLLVIVPANLRKQWAQELADKFFLPSVILEARSFNDAVRAGNLNPFQQDAIVICSYQFARSKEPYLRQTPWDLVVIDEAHRLRNVYKTTSKIALAIKQAVAPFPKVLLTATPLQNSLLELYGLVSIIDDYRLRRPQELPRALRAAGQRRRLRRTEGAAQPICKRTLRQQVLEYVKYTNRHALVQEFVPSPDEQRLYDLVSDYLQRPTLYALPASQRQLVTLILRKLLASSTYAISGTLEGLANRLEAAAAAAEAVDGPPEDDCRRLGGHRRTGRRVGRATSGRRRRGASRTPHARAARRTAAGDGAAPRVPRPGQVHRHELQGRGAADGPAARLRGRRRGPAEPRRPRRCSRRPSSSPSRAARRSTCSASWSRPSSPARSCCFNGTNTDPQLQGDLPGWLEQHAGTDRISGSPTRRHARRAGRALPRRSGHPDRHRGRGRGHQPAVLQPGRQLRPALESAARSSSASAAATATARSSTWWWSTSSTRANAADQRVYELLDEKFRLFNGVFGASDEVLGAVESGVDFEKRIAAIYQKCRTPEQIQFEFDQLQRELEAEISAGQRDAREKLLDNFDQEVVEKVRIQSHACSTGSTNSSGGSPGTCCADYAQFDDDGFSFTLHTNPFPGETIHPGPYRMGKSVEDANTYRVGHPLAQRVLATRQGRWSPSPAK